MFDYLQKFNSLPQELRAKISSPKSMEALSYLEKKYQVDLAVLVMKVMIKSIALKDLPAYFVSEWQFDKLNAENLAKDLTSDIFSLVPEHLPVNIKNGEIKKDDKLQEVIKAAGLTFPSSDLLYRFQNILSTYLKGVRSRISVRDALAKEISLGGLNLNDKEIDGVLKACDRYNQTDFSKEISLKQPLSRLDEIMSIGKSNLVTEEYDLKKALASGQVKKPEYKIEAPEKTKEISAPEEVKSLEAPEVIKKLEAPDEAAVLKEIEEKLLIEKKEEKKEVEIKAPEQIKKPEIISNPLRSSIVNPKSTVAVKTEEKKEIPSHPPVISAARVFNQTKENPVKPVMHDVRPVTRVMGPIEELKFLDLLNFRRLGKTPAEISVKIFNKIKLLEEGGYDKMIAGVRAWRQSPVNLLYLKMMQEAVSKGMTIKDLVGSVKDKSDRYLSLEEIEEIIKMNSRLVF